MKPTRETVGSDRLILADGRAHTGAEIAAALGTTRLRTVGEAVEELIAQGVPIASRSANGYRLTTSADELERSLAEVERRARKTLLRRRHLRRALAALRGQRQLALGGLA